MPNAAAAARLAPIAQAPVDSSEPRAHGVPELSRAPRAGPPRARPEGGVDVPAGVRLRPARAVRRTAGVDDTRVDRPDVGDVDVPSRPPGRQDVGQEDIALRCQAQQQVVAFIGRDVQADAALAPVGQLDHVGHTALRDQAGGDQAALRVAAHRMLDLDHVRAPLGQDRAGHGHVRPGRHLEHADSAHDRAHCRLLVIDGSLGAHAAARSARPSLSYTHCQKQSRPRRAGDAESSSSPAHARWNRYEDADTMTVFPDRSRRPGVDLDFTAEQEEFREEVRTWLAEHTPTAPRPPLDAAAMREYDLSWQRTQRKDGWAGIAWPEQYGGRGLSPVQQLIWHEEYARTGMPSIGASVVGPTHAGATLITRGTEQ